MTTELIVFIAFVLGGILHTTAGFGSALVAMPIITLVIDVRVATPVQALGGIALCVLIFYQHRDHWLWWESLPLILGALIGIPIGTYALTSLPESLVLGCLAVVILGYALFDFVTTRRRGHGELFAERPAAQTATKLQSGSATVVGLLCGILAGAYATGGPPVVIYAAIRRWHKERFKSILQSLFIFSGAFLLIWEALNGLITRDVGWYSVFAFPGLIAGTAIGSVIDRRIDRARFEKLVISVLVVLGIMLLLRSLSGVLAIR